MKRALFVTALFLSLAAQADLPPSPAPTPVSAQAQPATDVDPSAADAPSTTFRAADPSKFKEDLKGVPFMVGAYAAIWALLFGYVVLLVRRTKSLEGEVSALRQDLARAQTSQAGK